MWAVAEARLGRPLTWAEKQLDLPGLDSSLTLGKEALLNAIRGEQQRAVYWWNLHRAGGKIVLHVTPLMTDALVDLYRDGQRHAEEEIRRIAGVEPVAKFAEKIPPELIPFVRKLVKHLHVLQTRLNDEAPNVPVGASLGARQLAALLNTPGALTAAAGLNTGPFFAGMGGVYEANKELFAGWDYSAVLDQATCDVCAAMDGESFDTLEEALQVLPDFGGNPDCYGGDRCRCRLLPSGEPV